MTSPPVYVILKYKMRDIDLFFEDVYLLLKSKFLDLEEFINYEILRISPPSGDCLDCLPKSIDIRWTYDKKNKSFYAESSSHPEIYTAGNSVEEVINSVNDAVYTYYDIPRYLAKRLGNRYLPPQEAFDKLPKGVVVKTTMEKLAYA